MKKKFIKIIILLSIFLFLVAIFKLARAQEVPPAEPDPLNPPTSEVPAETPLQDPPIFVEHLFIHDGDAIILKKDVNLPENGSILVTDSDGASNNISARSVLGLLYALDGAEDAFSISHLTYYSSFGAFYLKCLSFGGNEKCDNWQYKINGEAPSMGMDSEILTGDENIEIYYEVMFWESDPVPPAPDPVDDTNGKATAGDDNVVRHRGGGSTMQTVVTPESEVVPADAAIPFVSSTVSNPTLKTKKEKKVESPIDQIVVATPASTPMPDIPLMAAVGKSGDSSKIPDLFFPFVLIIVLGYLGQRYL